MLVRREALEAAGGIASVRAEIIDDCALATRLKAQGPIWLGLTMRARSLRPYARWTRSERWSPARPTLSSAIRLCC